MKYKDINLGVRVSTPHGPGKIVGYPSIIHKLRDYYDEPSDHAWSICPRRGPHRVEVQLDGIKWPKGWVSVSITEATLNTEQA